MRRDHSFTFNSGPSAKPEVLEGENLARNVVPVGPPDVRDKGAIVTPPTARHPGDQRICSGGQLKWLLTRLDSMMSWSTPRTGT